MMPHLLRCTTQRCPRPRPQRCNLACQFWAIRAARPLSRSSVRSHSHLNQSSTQSKEYSRYRLRKWVAFAAAGVLFGQATIGGNPRHLDQPSRKDRKRGIYASYPPPVTYEYAESLLRAHEESMALEGINIRRDYAHVPSNSPSEDNVSIEFIPVKPEDGKQTGLHLDAIYDGHALVLDIEL